MKAKKKEQGTKVVDVLNDEYKVIFCWGDAKYVKKTLDKWHYPKDIDVDVELYRKRGVAFHTDACHPLIAMPKFPKNAEEIGVLAHEATHAITDLFNYIGEDSKDEVYAHCVGAVVRKVLEK